MQPLGASAGGESVALRAALGVVVQCPTPAVAWTALSDALGAAVWDRVVPPRAV